MNKEYRKMNLVISAFNIPCSMFDISIHQLNLITLPLDTERINFFFGSEIERMVLLGKNRNNLTWL